MSIEVNAKPGPARVGKRSFMFTAARSCQVELARLQILRPGSRAIPRLTTLPTAGDKRNHDARVV